MFSNKKNTTNNDKQPITRKSKLRKRLLIFSGVIITLIALIIIFISPITKYMVEKYDKKIVGREITMDWAYVNPFTGYLHFSNLKIYENKSDTIFIAAAGLSVNFELNKLFSKTYEISDITLDKPLIYIVQNDKNFNFNDIVEHFSSKDEEKDTTKAPTHFNMLNIKIKDGEFHFREKNTPVNYFVKKVDISSKGVRWDLDTFAADYAFLSGLGSGSLKGNFAMNYKNMDFKLSTAIQKLDLKMIEQYLKNLTNYGNFSAFLDADIKAKGNFKNGKNLSTNGMIAISDFHFGKTPREDYAAFDQLKLNIIELSPNNKKYIFDSVQLLHPKLKYERYDYLDNVQAMFGARGENIEAGKAAEFNLIITIANYVKLLSENFFESYYKINRLDIKNADLIYNDYAISEKCNISLDPMNFMADSIDKNNKKVSVLFKSKIEPYGDVNINLNINPKNSGDFDMNYRFSKIPATMFNPYLISYTSFPMDRGTIELNGDWKVRDGVIASKNNFTIIDPRQSKRIRNKDLKWIPMPLIFYFVRERGNVIDYEIPITGDLNNPKFHLKDIIFDVLTNIFIKPPTTPYRLTVRNTEAEIEKSLALNWNMRKSTPQQQQHKFIKKMANFLRKNPEANIVVYPQNYTIKEKEYILFYEAKKKYYIASRLTSPQDFTEKDAEKVDKMSVKDPDFVAYLDKKVKGKLLFTIQEKCAKLVDSNTVNIKYKQLNQERENTFLTYFKEEGVEKQIKLHTPKSTIPYNGFSFYKIEYKGVLPKDLIDAYEKLNDLNDKAPRNKFKKERKKYKII